MKKIFRTALILTLALVMSGILSACGMKDFEGDLRVRYDYDLKDYLKTGKYSDLTVFIGDTNVTDQELKNAVNRNRVFGCDWIDIEEGGRACQKGDIVGISFQGYTLEEGKDKRARMISSMCKGFINGEPMEELEGSSKVLSVVLGCDELLPGLDEQIIGNFAVGDRKTLKAKIPEPSWTYPEYSGMEIEIDIICTYIQEIEYQEYNNEYTSESGYGSVENYEMSMKNSLIKTRTSQVENYVNTRVWMQIHDNFEVKKYPEKELAEVRENLLKTVQTKADKKELSLEDYVKTEYGIEMDVFNAELDEQAKYVVKDEMIIYYIARNEQLALTDPVYEEKALEMANAEEFSDIQNYVVYRAYYYGYVKSGEEINDDARQKAENALKQEILFKMVDEFVYNSTIQKTA